MPEAVDRVPSLPRGICNGVLLPDEALCTVTMVTYGEDKAISEGRSWRVVTSHAAFRGGPR